MRKLTITRKKSLVGAIIPYYCIIGEDKEFVDANDTQYPIKNGETISIDVDDRKFCIVIASNTSTGVVVMPPFICNGGTNDVSLELITKYHLLKGSRYELQKNSLFIVFSITYRKE